MADERVVREMDVYLSSSCDEEVFLLQFPVRSAARGAEKFVGARIRRKNRMLELETQVDERYHFDADAPAAMKLKRRKLSSLLVSPATNYGIVTQRDGALRIAPLKTTLQMRPDLTHVDEKSEQPPKTLQSVHVKQPRKTSQFSYAHKRAQQESENWEDLEVVLEEQDDSSSKTALDGVFGSSTTAAP